MKSKKAKILCGQIQALGVEWLDAVSLRRIALTFHRCDENSCGTGNDFQSWADVRDEETGKLYREVSPHTGKCYRYAIPDRERGAEKRLAKIMAGYPQLVAYRQGDCRGPSLYLVRVADLRGRNLADCYTVGLAICN